jgi:hypothetical protein
MIESLLYRRGVGAKTFQELLTFTIKNTPYSSTLNLGWGPIHPSYLAIVPEMWPVEIVEAGAPRSIIKFTLTNSDGNNVRL